MLRLAAAINRDAHMRASPGQAWQRHSGVPRSAPRVTRRRGRMGWSWSRLGWGPNGEPVPTSNRLRTMLVVMRVTIETAWVD